MRERERCAGPYRTIYSRASRRRRQREPHAETVRRAGWVAVCGLRLVARERENVAVKKNRRVRYQTSCGRHRKAAAQFAGCGLQFAVPRATHGALARMAAAAAQPVASSRECVSKHLRVLEQRLLPRRRAFGAWRFLRVRHRLRGLWREAIFAVATDAPTAITSAAAAGWRLQACDHHLDAPASGGIGL